MIEIVFFDIDGVLTDGMVYIDSAGNESKRISFDDIDAIFELKRNGIKIGFITGENNSFSEYVKKRFEPNYFISGCKDKLSAYKQLKEEEGFDESKTCFVGDSTKDVELLEYLDCSFVPSDVDSNIKKSAGYVTNATRGNRVIKEVSLYILKKKKAGQADTGIDIDRMLKKGLDEHLNTIKCLGKDESLLEEVSKAAIAVLEAFKSGGKLLICGNGGSAADSQHLATELVSRFFMERKALDAEALTINTSSLTAIGNDYSFDKIFSRQIEAKAKKGDVLLAISTSGNSKNVVEAIKAAQNVGAISIGMTGQDTGSMINQLADYCIRIPSNSTPRIQEAHILIGHVLCEFIEAKLFTK